jgi:hypothetical protein
MLLYLEFGLVFLLATLSFVICTELVYLSAVVCTTISSRHACFLKYCHCMMHPFTWVPFNNDLLNLDDELMTRFVNMFDQNSCKKLYCFSYWFMHVLSDTEC